VNTAELADRITAIGPLRLLFGLGGEDGRTVWDEAGRSGLSALALDAEQPTRARLLAAELLAENASGWVPDGDEAAVAQLYVRALREHVVPANRWGLPGTVGPAGTHLLDLGAAARSALRPALDDDSRVEFSGSREVSLGLLDVLLAKGAVDEDEVAKASPPPPAVVDCEDRWPVCHGICCRLSFALTLDEVEAGHVRWDLGRP
jgi:hypothetical protein